MITIDTGVIEALTQATSSVFTEGLSLFALLIAIPVSFYVLKRVASMFPYSK